MKNVHILPTDKPSRLQINKHGTLFLSMEAKSYSDCTNQNIYITSDEEIKKGDWGLSKKRYLFQFCSKIAIINNVKEFSYKKIILTTDQDLIKDGVQAIDDEFLEWFINNPSCEDVDIDAHVQSTENGHILYYQIIIPKEELSKDEIDKFFVDMICNPKEEPKQVELLGGIEKGKRYVIVGKTKQETLEEAAERSAIEQFEAGNSAYILGFVEGAKWNQERSYSESEVLILLHDRDVHNMHFPSTFNKGWKTPKEWFEQIKKK